MLLTVLDLILLLAIFMFVAFGFALGFVHALGALIGIIVGAWVATAFYLPIAEWIEPIFMGNAAAAALASFLFLFILTNRLFGIIVWLLDKSFKLISIIPLTKTLNRLLGAAFGLLEGTFIVGLVMAFLLRLDFFTWLNDHVAGSVVARVIIFITSLIGPILPELFRHLRELV